MATTPAGAQTLRVGLHLSRDEVAARGQEGAAVTHARHDPRNLTEAGRAAFLSRFVNTADPQDSSTPDERAGRAADLRRARVRGIAGQSAEAGPVRAQTPPKRSEPEAA